DIRRANASLLARRPWIAPTRRAPAGRPSGRGCRRRSRWTSPRPVPSAPRRRRPMAVPNSAVPQPWSAHVRATVVLALPLVGTQLAQTAMNVTDTLMLGWLGAEGLAAGILGTQAFFIVYIFGVGFSQAVMPL